MANPDLAAGALAKPEPRKRVKDRAERVQAKADKLVYSLVTARDNNRCRVCKRSAFIVRIHRHHLRGRAYTATRDVLCLCEDCHGLIHPRVGGTRLRVSGDADKSVLIERRLGGDWYEEGYA